MLRKLILFCLFFGGIASAQTYSPYTGFCTNGAVSAVTNGLYSTNTLQSSYTQCTVSVNYTGTTSPVPLYSNNTGTVLSNPFTAGTDGKFQFYAGPGTHVDITMSGGFGGLNGLGIPAPYTLSDQIVGGGGAPSLPQNSYQYDNNGAFAGSSLFTASVYGPVTKLPRTEPLVPDFSSGGPIGQIAIAGGACSGTFTVSISAPPVGGTQASATGYCFSGIPYVGNIFPGGGYTSPPTVTLSGSGITGTATTSIPCTPGAADPTGTSDSGCAIQNSIDWAYLNAIGTTPPSWYLPVGTYLSGIEIKIPCEMHVWGDGNLSSTIEATHNDNLNALTVYPGPLSPVLNQYTCNGTMKDIAVYASGGHLFFGTLLDMHNAVGYDVENIRLSNGGGIGLHVTGNTERFSSRHITIDTTRWPIVAVNNELKFYDTIIDGPGQDQNQYCYTRNCINGVFPAYQAGNQSLVAATANGTLAAFTVSGNNGIASGGTSPLSGAPNGQVMPTASATVFNGVITSISWVSNGSNYAFTPDVWVDGCQGENLLPVISGTTITGLNIVYGGECSLSNGVYVVQWEGGGNWFNVLGISDITALNGFSRIQNVFNQCSALNSALTSCVTSSPTEYVVTTPSLASGTSTLSGSPVYQLAMAGVTTPGSFTIGTGGGGVVIGGSIKANWYQGCFTTVQGFSQTIEGIYCESDTQNGQPAPQADFQSIGRTWRSYVTQAITNNLGKVHSTLWALSYNSSTAYAAAGQTGWQATIFPQDYSPNSATCSAYVTTPTGGCVQQDEFENVSESTDPFGNIFLQQRNLTGSTVPVGNINWPIGSVVKERNGSFAFAPTTLRNMHWRTTNCLNIPTARWASKVDDISSFICGTAIQDEINDLVWWDTNRQITSTFVEYDSDEWAMAIPAPPLANRPFLVKILGAGTANFTYAPGNTAIGQFGGALEAGAPLEAGTIAYAVPSATGVVWEPTITYPRSGTIYSLQGNNSNGNAYRSQIVNSGVDPITGFISGYQFMNQDCAGGAPVGNVATSTSISSNASQVTILMPNSFYVGEWVALGLNTGIYYSENYTSTLGAMLNGMIVQLVAGTSATQIVFNFSNSGYSAASDVGTAYPVSSWAQCLSAGPVNTESNAGQSILVRSGGTMQIPTFTSLMNWTFNSNAPTSINWNLTGSETITGNFTAQSGGDVGGVVMGQPLNLVTWSRKIGYTTGAGCPSNCWTLTNATVTLDTTDFAAPDGTFTMTKISTTTGSGTAVDFNGGSLTSGTPYSVSFYGCTNATSGNTWFDFFVGNASGGNSGYNMPSCTTGYEYYCAVGVVPTGSLTNTLNITLMDNPVLPVTAYVWGASVVPGSAGCPPPWVTAGTFLSVNGTGAQSTYFFGSLIDTTQSPGIAEFNSSGQLVSSGGSTSQGVATLTAGTATVSTTSACTVGASCHYQLAHCGIGSSTAFGVLGVGTITPGTSFVINSYTAGAITVQTGDLSSVCWSIQ